MVRVHGDPRGARRWSRVGRVSVLLAAAAVVLTPVRAHAAQVLMGNQSVGTWGDWLSGGRSEAFQFTATATGTGDTVEMYVDTPNTATVLTAGIYTNAAGHPGALIAQGSLNSPVATSWNAVPLSSGAPLTSGTLYWIAVLGDIGHTLRERDVFAGAAGDEDSAQSNLVTLPGSWSSGPSFTNAPISAYVTSSTSSATVTLTSGGALSWVTAPGGITFPSIPLSSSAQTSSQSLPLDVSDLSGSGSGWNVQLSGTAFTSGAYALPAGAVQVGSAPVPSCDWVGECTVATNGLGFPFTLSTSAQKLFNAAVNTGMGDETISPSFAVTVPATAYSGTYTATWTLSLASGP